MLSRPRKVMDFRENGQSHGRVMEFSFFDSDYFVLFEKVETFSLSSSKKMQKGWVFNFSLINLNWPISV